MKLLVSLLLAMVLVPTAIVVGSLFVPAKNGDLLRATPRSPGAAIGVADSDPGAAVLRQPIPSSTRAAVPPEVGADSADRADREAQSARARRRAKAERLIQAQTLERARRLAEQVGVDPAGEEALADLFVAQRQRYEALQSRLTALPRQERRQALREGNTELRAWLSKELGSRFGPGVAERLQRPYLGAATSTPGDEEG